MYHVRPFGGNPKLHIRSKIYLTKTDLLTFHKKYQRIKNFILTVVCAKACIFMLNWSILLESRHWIKGRADSWTKICSSLLLCSHLLSPVDMVSMISMTEENFPREKLF